MLKINELQFDLSECFVTHGRPKNEAEVRYNLLGPLLRKVSRSASLIPVPGDCGIGKLVYTSSLNYEVDTEDRGSQPGTIEGLRTIVK